MPQLNNIGEMAEWLKAAVLKTVRGESSSRVRIPLSPPLTSSCWYVVMMRPQLAVFVPYRKVRNRRRNFINQCKGGQTGEEIAKFCFTSRNYWV